MDKTHSTTTTALENLPPEVEEGNVEYKLKLINPTDSRLEHLITQMKWRLKEGCGEATYKIGVEDDGNCAGLNDVDLESTLSTLKLMAERLGAKMKILRKREVNESDEERRQVAEIFFRRVPDDQQFLDIRVSVLGSGGAGKSTLVGVLSHGQLDNGSGRTRLNLFRHLHEVQSGRTSSICHEIMGFDTDGSVINFSENRSAEEICAASSKILTFIDLAGHQKYLKTTIFGLTSHQPDFALLVVDGNAGITNTTREHLGYALALNVPTIAAITKIDICSSETIERNCRMLKNLFTSIGCGRIPFQIRTEDDVYVAADKISSQSNFIPFFTTSSVTGVGINLLTKFFNVLPPRKDPSVQEKLMQEPVKFQIDEVYSVPEVGVVVGGTLQQGTVKEGEQLLIGPSSEGDYRKTTATTIQRNRAPCRIVCAGQAASLSIEGIADKEEIRKGMVLISASLQPSCCIKFTALIYLSYHPAGFISRGFQSTVHVGNVRQTAIIEDIQTASKKMKISVGEQNAVASFRFVCHPEYIEVGSTLLFREQTTKGIGQIIEITPFHKHDRYSLHKKRLKTSSSVQPQMVLER